MNKNTYSTDERQVGYWINGKPIYQTTINFGTLPNTAIKTVAHGISDIDTVVNVWGIAEISGGGYWMPITSPGPNNYTYGITVEVRSTTIGIRAGSDRSSWSAYATIQYTKTTD